jgi:dipeptidyl aminopeptidase/acylaminoacyl peptidase
MTRNRARVRALTAITTTASAAIALAGAMPEELGAQRAGNWSLCGAGEYVFTAGGQNVGRETFEITCHPDGRYTATGRTQLSGMGAGIDLTTHLELGADLVPGSASAKGTVNGQPFDQSATFTNGTATLSTNGQSQSVPYAKGASWLGGNIFYTNVFILARYDEAKAGAQRFPVFPQLAVTVERGASDGVRLDNGESATFTRFALRVATQEILFWRDAAGRLAVIAVPAQKFGAARPEAAKWLPALMAHSSEAGAAPASPQSPSASSAEAIDYSAPAGASFTAEEVTIPVATYSLAGTLLVPKSGTRHPAAVMITGSGLQTRDQRIPLPGLEGYAPFRQIAERLASNGVAVLRVDDRGIGGSTGRETLENATTTSLAEDTRAQIAWLRTRKEIDPNRIVVIGHSEGASIAAMIGASDPKLAAVVMMAGVAKRGADVSFEQQEDMLRSDTTMTEAMKQSLREQQKEAVKSVLAGGDIPGQKTNAWIREYFNYDPLPTARKIRQPLLVLQGGRDRQVYEAHAQMLGDAVRGAGNKDVTVKVFPTLNHLFLPSTTGSFSEYGHLQTNALPDDVLDVLTDWVRKRTTSR